MALILSIETATHVCSIALHNKGQLVAHSDFFVEKAHGSILTPAIQFLLKQAGYALTDLAAITVSRGPGSYTGLRIGVSIAKGLCFSLNIPLISVDTLQIMAQEVKSFTSDPNCLLCPMLDARRMEVYTGVYNHQLQVIMPVKAVIIDAESAENLTSSAPIVFFGNGVVKCSEVLSRYRNTSIIEGVYPSARWAGVLAHEKWENGQFENLTTFEPFYLKEFIANRVKT